MVHISRLNQLKLWMVLISKNKEIIQKVFNNYMIWQTEVIKIIKHKSQGKVWGIIINKRKILKLTLVMKTNIKVIQLKENIWIKRKKKEILIKILQPIGNF